MIEIIPNWHPLFVHFTVALFSLSVIFFVIQRPLAETEIGDNFMVFARYSLWLGVLFSIATIVAGWDAYNTVNHDTPSHTAMTEHRNWGLVTFAIFLIAGIWWKAVNRISERASIAFLLCLFIGAGLLVTTGHKGSKLVYFYGLGVESLPKKDDHQSGGGHGHSHADAQGHSNGAPADHHADEVDSGNAHLHDEMPESSGHEHAHDSIESGHNSIDMGKEKTPEPASDDMKMENQTMEPSASASEPIKADIVSVVKPDVVSKSKVETVPNIVSKPEREAARKVASKPEVAVEPKVVSKSEIAAETKVVSKPEVASEPKVVSKSEVASETKLTSKPEVAVEPKVVSKSEIAAETKAVSKPEVASEPEVASKPEVAVEPEVASKSEVASEPEIVNKLEVASEPKVENKSKTKESVPKIASKPKVESEPKVVSKPKEVIVSEPTVAIEINEDNTFLIPANESNTFIIPKIEKYEDGTIRETLPDVAIDNQN